MSDSGAFTYEPGWYPDPQQVGQQRWWDGNQWSEHVTPGGHTPDAGLAPAGGPSGPGSSRFVLLGLGAVVAAILVVIGVAAVFRPGAAPQTEEAAREVAVAYSAALLRANDEAFDHLNDPLQRRVG